jgi:hypothetical protein
MKFPYVDKIITTNVYLETKIIITNLTDNNKIIELHSKEIPKCIYHLINSEII